MFNRVRIDHFRGLESFWAVPATKLNAIEGEWLPAKGYKLLQKFREQVGDLPLVAENLGVITSEVERLRKDFNLPGMKVIQFAFGSDAKNEHLPHNYSTDDIAFSGTHDNNSTLGWLCSTKGEERKMAMRYLAGVSQVAVKEALRQIWASAAQTTIAPVQDLLLLGSKARFNTPGTVSGNWLWRLKRRDLSAKTFTFIAELTKMYNR